MPVHQQDLRRNLEAGLLDRGLMHHGVRAEMTILETSKVRKVVIDERIRIMMVVLTCRPVSDAG